MDRADPFGKKIGLTRVYCKSDERHMFSQVSISAVLVAFVSLFTEHINDRSWTALIAVNNRENIDGVYVGELGRAQSDNENVLGSLALLPTPNEQHNGKAKVRIDTTEVGGYGANVNHGAARFPRLHERGFNIQKKGIMMPTMDLTISIESNALIDFCRIVAFQRLQRLSTVNNCRCWLFCCTEHSSLYPSLNRNK
jgi:hypothetical protein